MIASKYIFLFGGSDGGVDNAYNVLTPIPKIMAITVTKICIVIFILVKYFSWRFFQFTSLIQVPKLKIITNNGIATQIDMTSPSHYINSLPHVARLLVSKSIRD